MENVRVAERFLSGGHLDNRPRELVILGSTGSIGTQAVDLVTEHPERFRVVGLAAGGGRVDLLADQACQLGVDTVAIADPTKAPELVRRISERGHAAKVLTGTEGIAEIAGWPCDVVLNGVTGALGLEATLAALRAGRLLALANKESLIIGGPLVRAAAQPGQIIPVDSEHFALAQCFPRAQPADLTSLAQGQVNATLDEVRRLVITASGGPFRGWSRTTLAGVTREQALNHPTWDMGPVITVNSATLVNKGLEVIEAHLLFDVPFDRLEVVVHPQSVIHSMVEYTDGSTLAQASPPSMRIPIANGIGWPHRVSSAAPGVDWTKLHTWTFEPLDVEAFPAVALACEVGTAGGTAPAVYNAANEEAVDAFLGGRLAFTAIVDTVAQVVSEHRWEGTAGTTLSEIYAADEWARVRARELIAQTA